LSDIYLNWGIFSLFCFVGR